MIRITILEIALEEIEIVKGGNLRWHYLRYLEKYMLALLEQA